MLHSDLNVFKSGPWSLLLQVLTTCSVDYEKTGVNETLLSISLYTYIHVLGCGAAMTTEHTDDKMLVIWWWASEVRGKKVHTECVKESEEERETGKEEREEQVRWWKRLAHSGEVQHSGRWVCNWNKNSAFFDYPAKSVYVHTFKNQQQFRNHSLISKPCMLQSIVSEPLTWPQGTLHHRILTSVPTI